MRHWQLQVEGMHCASCPLLVDDFLEDVPGVIESRTDLRTGLAQVIANEEVSLEQLLAAVKESGYQAKALP